MREAKRSEVAPSDEFANATRQQFEYRPTGVAGSGISEAGAHSGGMRKQQRDMNCVGGAISRGREPKPTLGPVSSRVEQEASADTTTTSSQNGIQARSLWSQQSQLASTLINENNNNDESYDKTRTSCDDESDNLGSARKLIEWSPSKQFATTSAHQASNQVNRAKASPLCNKLHSASSVTSDYFSASSTSQQNSPLIANKRQNNNRQHKQPVIYGNPVFNETTAYDEDDGDDEDQHQAPTILKTTRQYPRTKQRRRAKSNETMITQQQQQQANIQQREGDCYSPLLHQQPDSSGNFISQNRRPLNQLEQQQQVRQQDQRAPSLPFGASNIQQPDQVTSSPMTNGRLAQVTNDTTINTTRHQNRTDNQQRPRHHQDQGSSGYYYAVPQQNQASIIEANQQQRPDAGHYYQSVGAAAFEPSNTRLDGGRKLNGVVSSLLPNGLTTTMQTNFRYVDNNSRQFNSVMKDSTRFNKVNSATTRRGPMRFIDTRHRSREEAEIVATDQPLIRSTSWQNKTRIDLGLKQQPDEPTNFYQHPTQMVELNSVAEETNQRQYNNDDNDKPFLSEHFYSALRNDAPGTNPLELEPTYYGYAPLDGVAAANSNPMLKYTAGHASSSTAPGSQSSAGSSSNCQLGSMLTTATTTTANNYSKRSNYLHNQNSNIATKSINNFLINKEPLGLLRRDHHTFDNDKLNFGLASPNTSSSSPPSNGLDVLGLMGRRERRQLGRGKSKQRSAVVASGARNSLLARYCCCCRSWPIYLLLLALACTLLATVLSPRQNPDPIITNNDENISNNNSNLPASSFPTLLGTASNAPLDLLAASKRRQLQQLQRGNNNNQSQAADSAANNPELFQQQPPPLVAPPYDDRPSSNHELHHHHSTTTLAPATTTTTTTTPPELATPQASTQGYWLETEPVAADSIQALNGACFDGQNLECSLRGRCDPATGKCRCFAGSSGPQCAKNDCPNECSHRGRCQLRDDLALNQIPGLLVAQQPVVLNASNQSLLQSIGFQTLTWTRRSNSQCASELMQSVMGSNDEAAQYLHSEPATFDQRARWQCKCDEGSMGADCGQLRELYCDNKEDDDQDGLTDCEDDDCCSQPACKDNHLCYMSPDPSKLLAELSSSNQQFQASLQQQQSEPHIVTEQLGEHQAISQEAFFAQFKFFIANNSVQLYAKERSFDPAQMAVIRGRVVRGPRPKAPLNDISESDDEMTSNGDQDAEEFSGIVSVHVRVADTPTKTGFTLTRSDGSFDLLVPASNSWITLHFLRNAYAEVERRLFVRPHTITVLESPVVMQLASESPATASDSKQQQQAGSAGDAIASSDSGGSNAAQQMTHLQQQGSFGIQQLVQLHKVLMTWVQQQHRQLDENQIGRLLDCLRRSIVAPAPKWRLHEPTIRTTSGASLLKSFRLASTNGFETSLNLTSDLPPLISTGGRQVADQLELHYNSATFPPAASIVKPLLSLELMSSSSNDSATTSHDPNNHEFKLTEIQLHLDIDGQLVSERLKPIESSSLPLMYQFAWNRRNVYGAKSYGFSPLNIKITYKYKQLRNNIKQATSECLAPYNLNEDHASNLATSRLLAQRISSVYDHSRSYTFEGRVWMEAHQLNQHADLGKWTLGNGLSNRLDRLRQTLYLGSGRSIPLKLAYPPTVSEPIALIDSTSTSTNGANHLQHQATNLGHVIQKQPTSSPALFKQSKTMARGPNNSLYLIQNQRLLQLDSSGRRRLIDLSVNVLTSKFGAIGQQQADYVAENDLELIYNDQKSLLYVSSRVAGKIVQISHSTLVLLNRTAGPNSPGLLGPDDEIELEPLCGFGLGARPSSVSSSAATPLVQEPSQTVTSSTAAVSPPLRSCRSVRLSGPHSMALDERRQMLYFVDGNSSLMVLELASNLLTTLLSARISQPLSSLGPDAATTTTQARQRQQQQATIGSANSLCRRADLQLALSSYKPLILSSLVFSQSDQSVYFVDQNTVFALRQDLTLELVALGARPARADFIQSLAPACLAQKRASAVLGQIKALAIDEANHELVLAHQWSQTNANSEQQQQPSELHFKSIAQSFSGSVDAGQQTSSRPKNNNNKSKLIGRFYLAKLKLGLVESPTISGQSEEMAKTWHPKGSSWNPAQMQSQSQSSPLFDLHSAQATYDPMLASLMGNDKLGVDWPEVASAPNKLKPIPFLHLLFGGFERIDCLEISPDGSIFVLDSPSRSLRLVEPFNDAWLEASQILEPTYATSRLNNANKPTNNNFLEWTPTGPKQLPTIQQAHNTDTKSSLLMLEPISGDLMQFHAHTGLLLGLRKSKTLGLSSTASSSFGLQYELIGADAPFDWDEDDRNDFAIQRSFVGGSRSPPLVRFARIRTIAHTSQGDTYDIIRGGQQQQQHHRSSSSAHHLVARPKLNAQAIFVNRGQPIELACDMRGLLTKVALPSAGQKPQGSHSSSLWGQRQNFIYDSNTNLLVEQVIQMTQLTPVPIAGAQKQVSRRILHDNVFHHYCDLITNQ